MFGLFVLVFFLFRVALAGQSSDKTSESTNDSMSGGDNRHDERSNSPKKT